MPTRLEIDDQKVVELYGKGLSSRQIAKVLGISKSTALKRLREVNVERRPNRRRFFNEETFSRFTPESCYWAGFLAADGWIDKRQTVVSVELAVKDRGHLVKLCEFLGADPVMVTERDKRQPWGAMGHFCAVHFCSMRMVRMLEKNFNIVPRKSRTLKPPLLVPEHLVSHFVRGYFDGDGWFSWSRGNMKCGFCSGSRDFLAWLCSSLHTLANAKEPLLQQRPSSDLYSVEFHGRQQVPYIVSWLYAGSTDSSRLVRKYDDKTRLEAANLPTS